MESIFLGNDNGKNESDGASVIASNQQQKSDRRVATLPETFESYGKNVSATKSSYLI